MKRQRMVVFAVLLTAVAPAAAAQEHTFSIVAEEVRVDVLATDNGRPISDLEAADFEVIDNGVPQEILYAKPQRQMPISVTLVFDMSGSVTGSLLGRLKEAANGFLSDLESEDRAALITFNHAVVLGSPLTKDIERVKQALDRTQGSGYSSLIDASYAGLVFAESRSELPLVVIFSDGLDTFSWLREKAVLETAKRGSVIAYAVSTNRLPKKSFLGDLTEFTAGSLFRGESIDNLPAVFLQILNEFRQRYLLAYTPQGVPESGWHKLEVRIKNRSAKVRARPGYMRNSTASGEGDRN